VTKIQQELEICAQLEQHRYVLHELLKEKQMLYTALNNTNPKPPPPNRHRMQTFFLTRNITSKNIMHKTKLAIGQKDYEPGPLLQDLLP